MLNCLSNLFLTKKASSLNFPPKLDGPESMMVCSSRYGSSWIICSARGHNSASFIPSSSQYFLNSFLLDLPKIMFNSFHLSSPSLSLNNVPLTRSLLSNEAVNNFTPHNHLNRMKLKSEDHCRLKQ